MTFTVKNFRTEFPKAGITDSDLLKRFELMNKTKPEDYNNSEVVKRGIDMFVLQLNQRYGSKETEISEEEELTPTDKKVIKKALKKERQQKEKRKEQVKKSLQKESKEDNAQRVEKILPEVGFIKRFCGLDGKMVKTQQEKALRILNSLQKAIVEKVIRKTSPYADEIMKIQSNLIKIVDSKDGNAIIEIAEKYKEIAKSQKVSPEIAFIKAFISIQGKEGMKEKAKALRERISKSDVYPTEIMKSLDDYIAGETNTLEIDAQTLSGLYGLAGIEFETPKSGTSVQSTQFLGATFDTLPFTGKWANFIGKPNRNFKIMIYGKAGGGKSTVAIKFAHYLASNVGLRVLYVAGEEKLGHTLREKVERLNAATPNLYLNDKLPKDLSKFDVVFIDSINTLALEPTDLENLPNNKAYVWILQCTKAGNYRGSQAFEHNADAVIEVSDMIAKMGKNRFGGKERELEI